MAWNLKLSPDGSWCSLVDFLVSINVIQVCFNQGKPRSPKHLLFSVRKKQKQLSSLVMYMRMVTVSYFRIWIILDGRRQLGGAITGSGRSRLLGTSVALTKCLLGAFWSLFDMEKRPCTTLLIWHSPQTKPLFCFPCSSHFLCYVWEHNHHHVLCSEGNSTSKVYWSLT